MLPIGAALLAAGLLAPSAAVGGRCGEQTCRSDMSISGHAEPQPIRRGEKSTLKITPKNDGPDGALAVEVHVNVPSQLKILRTEVHGGFGCSVQGTFIDCEMGDFAKDQLGVIKVRVKGKRKGTYVSKARVFAYDIDDPNGGNGQVGITVGVQPRN
jgi:hypothetical protein